MNGYISYNQMSSDLKAKIGAAVKNYCDEIKVEPNRLTKGEVNEIAAMANCHSSRVYVWIDAIQPNNDTPWYPECSCVELEYSPIPDPACPLHGGE